MIIPVLRYRLHVANIDITKGNDIDIMQLRLQTLASIPAASIKFENRFFMFEDLLITSCHFLRATRLRD